MGAISGLVGLGGGAGGTSFAGPQQASQQGAQNMQQVYGQLQNVANGQGPNPAQQQYFQNVQNLAQQQAGAIGSIQGISPALAARMQTQAGSAAMQNAAAAGGANLAQQQLGALQGAGSLAGAQQNSANQMQANINNANASLAGTQMQGQQGVVGGLMSAGGATSSIGGAAAAMAEGGMVRKFADGGMPGPQSGFAQFLQSMQGMQPASGVQTMGYSPAGGSSVSGGLGGNGGTNTKSSPKAQSPSNGGTPTYTGGTATNAAIAPLAASNAGSTYDITAPNFPMSSSAGTSAGFAQGGKVKALVSPGELWIPPGKVKEVANGKNAMKAGERIPGKPKVPGNSYANDTVKKNLAVGGVVIPNSIMQSKDPAKGAHEFVAKIIAKRRAAK